MPDLLSASERLAEVADEIGETFARELALVKADLERELRRLLREAETGSRTAQIEAGRALALRRQLREALTLAGFDDLAAASTLTGLDRIVEAVEQLRIVAQVERFVSQDATRIAALKELARLNLLQQGDEVSIALWRSVVQNTFSGRKAFEILDDLAGALDLSLSETRTLYDTSVSIFGRQIEAIKADDSADTLFVFVGPVDAKMRPFCAERVGQVFTREEIDEMDNEQLPNPFLTGGGYNCRHQFQEISQFSELADLQGSGERAPEFQDAFDRVKSRLKLTQKAA